MTSILCPIDFSAHARSALRHALELARRAQSTVTVLFVSDPLLEAAAAAAAYDAAALRERSHAELRQFVAGAGGRAGDHVSLVTAFGQPAAEIEKAARRGGAELIVMGSHGLRGAGKWFFGSTTERVLRSSRVPVLVVPRLNARGRAAEARALAAWPGRRAVVAVDLDDYAIAEVRAALRAVQRLGAAPTLAYVVPPARWPSWLPLNASRQLGAQQK
jgi:nucleotide-binding universal stress UspA family protein